MMAERRTRSWNDSWRDRDAAGSAPEKAAKGAVNGAAKGATDRTGSHPATGQPACKRLPCQDRKGRLVEALLECTTIAGLFALLFALFVLFGAAHTLAP